MPRTATLALAGALIATLAAAPGATAARAADPPRFVGAPSVGYAGSSLVAVVRFDQAVAKGIDGMALVAGPSVRAGLVVDSSAIDGAEPAGSIGISSRHCYLVGPGRVDGAPALRGGARWRLGLRLPGARSILSSTRMTLRRGDVDQLAAAERLGCTAASSARARDRDLLGRAVRVTAASALVRADAPGRGAYVGTLLQGQRFRTLRTSPSGRYAYGLAYGRVNRRGYVPTKALR